MTRVAIINSGGANIASLQFALQRMALGADLTVNEAVIREASHVILPGVGAALDAMSRLRQCGLAEIIPTLTQPVLGICLGMQLLFEASEEEDARCLGVMRGRARRLPAGVDRPVPHMGWNTLEIRRPHPLLEEIGSDHYFYFVHSYAVPVESCTLAAARYGSEFSAVVAQDNFFGTQFHPERSGHAGARVLANFLNL